MPPGPGPTSTTYLPLGEARDANLSSSLGSMMKFWDSFREAVILYIRRISLTVGRGGSLLAGGVIITVAVSTPGLKERSAGTS